METISLPATYCFHFLNIFQLAENLSVVQIITEECFYYYYFLSIVHVMERHSTHVCLLRQFFLLLFLCGFFSVLSSPVSEFSLTAATLCTEVLCTIKHQCPPVVTLAFPEGPTDQIQPYVPFQKTGHNLLLRCPCLIQHAPFVAQQGGFLSGAPVAPLPASRNPSVSLIQRTPPVVGQNHSSTKIVKLKYKVFVMTKQIQ